MVKQINFISCFRYFFIAVYLISFFGKVLDWENWINFHYGLFNHSIGYVNAVLILLIEFYFLLRFLLDKIDVMFIDSNLIFVIFLTGIVALFPNLFADTCLCFGKLFEFSAGLGFFVKNTVLITFLFTMRILIVKRKF